MKVVTESGETIELGAVETTPTIGITDYSRRVTDDFGVTTIVERGFARKMSVKLGVPFDNVDVLQRRLAALRATPALWVADDRFACLSVRGFYKEFDLDLAVPPLSYCTLAVEGLAEAAAPADAGGDPAPAGLPSTLQLLQPVIMTNSVLAASNVAENDAAEWAGATSYPIGARVMKAAQHRVYESLVGENAGNDPAGASGKWLDVGPTNRWAMFDQALGTSTSSAGEIVVTLDPGTAGAVALLDVVAGTVRVQANGYDRMLATGAGAITFLDLPTTGQVTVTIAGPSTVSVGTLLIGRVVSLGITESSPTAGITDFSKKTVDDFGEVTIVQRAFIKRMSAKALIRTDAIDAVANRIAAVRALPSLWIGQVGLDSLTVYGFFKDFSIEVGETLSKLSLSIEGLSAAAKIEPLLNDVAWENVKDTNPAKPKPENGATVGAPSGTPVGNMPSDRVVDALAELAQTRSPEEIVAGARALVDRARAGMSGQLQNQLAAQADKARLDRLLHFDGQPLVTRVREEISERIEGQTAIVERVNEVEATAHDGLRAAQGAIIDAVRVAASAVAAETESRQQAISTVLTVIDGEVVARQAAITETKKTAADQLSAATQVLNSAISAVETLVEGEVTAREAAITEERKTNAGENGATAKLVSELASVVDGQGSSISFLLEVTDGKQAIAQLTTNVDGQITGFKINGAERLFSIAADRFVIGNSAIFEVDTVTGITRIKNAAIGVATIDTLNIKNGAFSNTSAVVVDGLQYTSGEQASSVSKVTTGGTLRLDVSFQSYRTSGNGRLTVQLFRSSPSGPMALTPPYKCPATDTVPPITFFAIDNPPAGQAEYFLNFMVDTGTATFNVLPQTFVMTEFKR